MDRINAMQAFVRCVERRSFSAVARELSTTQPTISKLIDSLERRLGGRLLVRATRGLAMTEEGQRYYEQCKAILDAVEHAELSFRSGREEVAGLLTVAAPVGFGRTQVVPRLKKLMDRHQSLKIDLQLSDHFVDLVEAGVDVAFRIGEVKSSTLLARRIGTARRAVFGSPAYFREHGEPASPGDLAEHECVIYSGLSSPDDWTFTRGGRSVTVEVAGRFRTNSSEAVREAVVSGMGIALSPLWLFSADVPSKRVKAVLTGFRTTALPIHAIFPANRRFSAKVRALVDYYQSEFEQDRDVQTRRQD